jgi:hypothetical protein
VIVSGKTYGACCDPDCTGVPAELGLPEPTRTRRGRGYQYRYDNLTEWQRDEMLHNMWVVGTGFQMGDDNETRAEGRAIMRDWERNR